MYGRKAVNDKLEMTWQRGVVAHLEALHRNSSGKTE